VGNPDIDPSENVEKLEFVLFHIDLVGRSCRDFQLDYGGILLY
jgi:hypothetical protein